MAATIDEPYFDPFVGVIMYPAGYSGPRITVDTGGGGMTEEAARAAAEAAGLPVGYSPNVGTGEIATAYEATATPVIASDQEKTLTSSHVVSEAVTGLTPIAPDPQEYMAASLGGAALGAAAAAGLDVLLGELGWEDVGSLIGGLGEMALEYGVMDQVIGGQIDLGGPGLAEPKSTKEWSIRMDSKQGDFKLQFYKLMDGRVACYNQRTKEWHVWRPVKPVVIGKKLPAHKQIVRLRRFLKKHQDDALTILGITAPHKLAKNSRRPRYFRRRR